MEKEATEPAKSSPLSGSLHVRFGKRPRIGPGQREKRRASRTPSSVSADPPEPYETIVLRHFREQLDEEYEDTPAECRNIIEAVAEDIEEFKKGFEDAKGFR